MDKGNYVSRVFFAFSASCAKLVSHQLAKTGPTLGSSSDLLRVHMLTASEANFCFEVGARSLSQRQVCCRRLHPSARVE